MSRVKKLILSTLCVLSVSLLSMGSFTGMGRVLALEGHLTAYAYHSHRVFAWIACSIAVIALFIIRKQAIKRSIHSEEVSGKDS